MKQKRRKPSDDLRAEYRFDYSKAERGKYRHLLKIGSNVVLQQKFTRGKIKYTDEPLGDLRLIRDLLPHSKELVFRIKGAKAKRKLRYGRKIS